MNWDDNLPDTTAWSPRKPDKDDNLGNGLLLTCRAAEARIIAEAKIEKGFNIDSFDSGVGVEDIIRNELQKLLPLRYSVHAGVINDSKGHTGGDYEVIILNKLWGSALKLGATAQSRRWHYPIEAVYSVIEIKQTLDFGMLDKALEKLVKCSRLERPLVEYGQLTENHHITNFDREGYILNPLATYVLGVGLREGITFKDLAKRFLLINYHLPNDEKINGLVVLGEGLAYHSSQDAQGVWVDANFMKDRSQQLWGQIFKS